LKGAEIRITALTWDLESLQTGVERSVALGFTQSDLAGTLPRGSSR
jgi:hypothetical protein